MQRTPAGALALRLTLTAAGGGALFGALLVLAYALAAARVPGHRLALERLVQAQTGLDLRFSELGLRWGWYGPEAVFHGVELREPGAPGALLRAPELVVGFDVWRMVRSGEPEAGRITLVGPDIELPGAAAPARGAPGPASRDGLELLARWRGTRFDIEGGTLRMAGAGRTGTPLTLLIRHASLRRAAAEWSAEARVVLPESLGAAARATLWMSGDPARPASLSGTLELQGERLEFAGWRTVLPPPAEAFVPRAGSGTLMLRARFASARLLSAAGRLRAEGLQWAAATADSRGAALAALRGEWRLARQGGGWHLSVDPLELPGSPGGATLTLDAAGDGSSMRGRIEHAPVAALAGLAGTLVPQAPLAALALDGTVREASFDFDAHRPPGERWRTAAELDSLALAVHGSPVRLEGLVAGWSGDGRHVRVAVHAQDARLARPASAALGNLELRGQVALDDTGRTWRLRTRDLEIRRGAARLGVSGTLSGAAAGGAPRLDARLSVSATDVALARELLGADGLAGLGDWAALLTAGRIQHAELEVHGVLDRPLPWSGTRRRFSGTLELRDASLAGAGARPDIQALDARITWRGDRVAALVAGARAGGFRLAAARAQWDARGAMLTRLAGRASGDAQEALGWLREHPQLAQYLPGAESLDLRGEMLIGFDARRAAAAADGAGAAGFATRITAALQGARWRPVAGLPAIDELRGTLTFADGRLQRSSLAGAWLGGPLALSVGGRRERGGAALAISARGTLNVRQALLAATGLSGAGSPLQGSAEWSAELGLQPAALGEPPLWSARADSNLIGVASALPEPFGKPATGALALHLELAGRGDSGQLRVGLGERLQGLLAVRRVGALWRIERGALSFAATEPALPPDAEVRVEGKVSRLDLAGYALLWRELAANPAWPALHADLTTAELHVAGLSFAQASLEADAAAGRDELRVTSAGLAGTLRWPAASDAAQPAIVELTRLDLPGLAAGDAAAQLGALLAPQAQLSVADLDWQGHPLGALTARLAARGGALELSDAHLTGGDTEAQGTLACTAARCSAKFSLESLDPAAALASLGVRADLSARRGVLSGELGWSPGAAGMLATAGGRLHMEFDDGAARSAPAAPGTGGARLGLLAVPALLAGMGSPQLAFGRLSADFDLRDGEATTSDLHFDGDAEILLRGRVGLLDHTYDARVWVLRGEQRLPALVRGLAPGTRIAALWLSLRELLAGTGRDRAALRLRGTWDDPMVTAAD